MADIFLSYSSEDKSKVRLIAYALEKMGWTVWWDRKIGAGKMKTVLLALVERVR